MPRDGGGFYNLPAGNPVVPGTIIESDWANPTMSDVAQELGDSLSRSGKGGMLAALRGPDGSAALPTFSFTNEPSTGRFRAGPGQVVEAVLGIPVVRYLASGLEQWDSNIADWVPLTPRDALGTPFDPAPSGMVATNVQDAIEEVYTGQGGVITADSVSYDDSTVYFPATTVQIAIDRIGADIPLLANDILDNADAIQLIGGTGGDVDLLTQRVTQNEINIGNNTTDISLHEIRLDNHDIDISGLLNDVSSIKLEQITQNSDIQQNATSIGNNYAITQTNADNIADNVDDISTNASAIVGNTNAINSNTDSIDFVFDITQDNLAKINTNISDINDNTNAISSNDSDIAYNLSRINTNQSNIESNDADILQLGSDIGGVYDVTQVNLGKINTNTTNISSNATNIAINAADLQAFNGIFPNGILNVANGGTGVNSKTGSGSVVLSSAPTLSGAYLSNDSFADKPATSDDSARLATTEWVKDQGYGGGGASGEVFQGSNSNGNWCIMKDLDEGTWTALQHGSGSTNSNTYYPITVTGTAGVGVTMNANGNTGGADNAIVMGVLTVNGFTANTGAVQTSIKWVSSGKYG